MAEPGYLSNAALAASISALVDRWNTREHQMISLLTSESDKVPVTDGHGVTRDLPPYPTVIAAVSDLLTNIEGPVGASRVGFQVAKPFTVARTVSNKLEEMPSVRDFGAVGNGTVDDTVALQRAINSGVPELFFPAGHYRITAPLKPVHNQSWIGIVGQTLIKPAPNAPTNTNVIAHNTTGADGPLVSFSMTGFVIDGNAKEGGLVLYGCQGLRVTDCTFQNCETYGLGLQARPGSTIVAPQDDIILTRCHFNFNGKNTIFDGLDVKHCTNTTLVACTATGNTDAGLNLRGTNLDLIGCQAVGNGTAGILLQSNDADVDSYIRVVGGQASGTYAGPGLEIQGNAGNTTHIEVSSFQSFANPGGDGVRLSGSGSIIGNVTALQSRDNVGSGVNITAASDDDSVVFTGGVLSRNAADGFKTAGKGAVLNGLALLENTGAGYREVNAANNNYLLPSCVISGNGLDIAPRVGTETDRGFLAVRSVHSVRAFPGLSSGLELQTDTDGLHSTVVSVGDAPSVGMRLLTKGNGSVAGFNNNGGRQLFEFRHAGSAIVNWPDFVASLTGTPVQFRASGLDANIDIQLVPKGTGAVRLGSFAAASDAPVTGYITVKDSAGNLRKLATIT